MATKTYAYVASPVDLQDLGQTSCLMHVSDVKGNITSRLEKDGYSEVLFFIDEESPSKDKSGVSSKRPAFDLMVSQLEKGNTVVMWSWECLINRSRPEWASFDVLDALRKIREKGCSVFFTREEICTSTAAGRLQLATILNMAQYQRDFVIERVTNTTKAGCCSNSNHSSPSGGLSVTQVVSRQGNGC